MPNRAKLEHFVSLYQAQEALHLDEDGLYQLIDNESLYAAVLPDGSLGISLTSLQEILPREELPDYKQFVHLQGTPISISEASRKYGVNTSTLTRWMQHSYITQLGKKGRQTLLDEADTAYCVGVYKSGSSGQGNRVFNEKGKPYKADKSI